jgi:hypothetical protein
MYSIYFSLYFHCIKLNSADNLSMTPFYTNLISRMTDSHESNMQWYD